MRSRAARSPAGAPLNVGSQRRPRPGHRDRQPEARARPTRSRRPEQRRAAKAAWAVEIHQRQPTCRRSRPIMLNLNAPNRVYIDGDTVYCAQANANPTTKLEDCTTTHPGGLDRHQGDAITADPILPPERHDDDRPDRPRRDRRHAADLPGRAEPARRSCSTPRRSSSYFIDGTTNGSSKVTQFEKTISCRATINYTPSVTRASRCRRAAPSPSISARPSASRSRQITCTGWRAGAGWRAGRQREPDRLHRRHRPVSRRQLDRRARTPRSRRSRSLEPDRRGQQRLKQGPAEAVRQQRGPDGAARRLHDQRRQLPRPRRRSAARPRAPATTNGELQRRLQPAQQTSQPVEHASPTNLAPGSPDTIELRYIGSRGTIITNPDGSYGMFLSGAWASDGDSDAFNQIFYTSSTQRQANGRCRRSC